MKPLLLAPTSLHAAPRTRLDVDGISPKAVAI